MTPRSIALCLALCLAAAGCKTPEEAAPTDSGSIPRDATPDAVGDASPDAVADASPADASPADASPADASPADASPADASPADASPADASVDADGGCAPGDGGCSTCPTTSAEIINRCTSASCARFDRARLTRLLADGGLPPLP